MIEYTNRWFNQMFSVFSGNEAINLDITFEMNLIQGPKLSSYPRKRYLHMFEPPYPNRKGYWIEVDKKTCYKLYSGEGNENFISFYDHYQFINLQEIDRDEFKRKFLLSDNYNSVGFLLACLLKYTKVSNITGLFESTLNEFKSSEGPTLDISFYSKNIPNDVNNIYLSLF